MNKCYSPLAMAQDLLTNEHENQRRKEYALYGQRVYEHEKSKIEIADYLLGAFRHDFVEKQQSL